MIRKLISRMRKRSEGTPPPAAKEPAPEPRVRPAPEPKSERGPRAAGSPSRPRRPAPPEPPAAAPESGAAPRAEPGQEGAPKRRRRRGGRGRRKRPGGAPGEAGPVHASDAAATGPEPDGAAAPAAEPWDRSQFEVPPKEGLSRFHDVDLPDPVMHAIADLGFAYCTPIQAEALPATLAGRDLAGRAQTGTGKTAAFLIRILQHNLTVPRPADRRKPSPRALVIAPTRELVMQIERDAEDLGKHSGCRVTALFGGADYKRQREQLALDPELVVATPGRLLDFCSRGELHLDQVEILVIDEADRMLDMGFIPDVRKIVYSTPPKERRQTLFFSATLTDDVVRLCNSWTREPVRVEIEPDQVAVDTVDQQVFVVTSDQKFPLLYNILQNEHRDRVLLFVNRRDTADWLAHELKRHHIDCSLISGALPQNQRTATLAAFREGRLRVLVATDVAGRGLHIEGISHVVNFNIPVDAEDYVHRIGRTGRAGATGTSVTFACEEESFYIPDIEKYIGRDLPCTHPRPEWLKLPEGVDPVASTLPDSRSRRRPGGPGGRGGRGGPRGRGGPPRGGPRGGGRRR